MAAVVNNIDYGTTGNGQMYERHQVGNRILMRTTTDTERFLRWVIASEITTASMIDQQINRKKGGNNW